jgi:hypothetical protein
MFAGHAFSGDGRLAVDLVVDYRRDNHDKKQDNRTAECLPAVATLQALQAGLTKNSECRRTELTMSDPHFMILQFLVLRFGWVADSGPR